MNIHAKIRRGVSLAKTYADDGAFLSAARTLREMAGDLESHHAATMPPGLAAPEPLDTAARLAALRSRGFHVYPSGSPSFPRWTVSRVQGEGFAVCEGDAATEAEAIDVAEAADAKARGLTLDEALAERPAHG